MIPSRSAGGERLRDHLPYVPQRAQPHPEAAPELNDVRGLNRADVGLPQGRPLNVVPEAVRIGVPASLPERPVPLDHVRQVRLDRVLGLVGGRRAQGLVSTREPGPERTRFATFLPADSLSLSSLKRSASASITRYLACSF